MSYKCFPTVENNLMTFSTDLIYTAKIIEKAVNIFQHFKKYF